MPRLPKLRTDALNELAGQLRFAPRETLRRQMERAEALAAEIDPAINYPEDWLVFKITGYRPELETPATFVGGALLADLSALVERLSAGAGLTWEGLPRGKFLSGEELRRRWGVSRRTIERWRRLGLLARRVTGRNGRARQAFPVASVEAFERAHPGELGGAKAYTRIDARTRAAMLRRAEVYHRRLGCSLNQTAERLARRFQRGHETVRQLLRRREETGPAIFGEKGRAGARERRLVERASRVAIEPGAVAGRVGRSRAAVRRLTGRQRVARLRALRLGSGPLTPETAIPHADRLGRPAPRDLLALVQFARAEPAMDVRTERAWAAAYQTLVRRSAAAIGGLPAHTPNATARDRIETDLRTAARLKAELVRSQLPLLVRSVDTAAGHACEQLRSDLLLDAVGRGLVALGEAVDQFDPGRVRSGRLAAPSGLALTRALAAWSREHKASLVAATGRATPRLGAGVAIPDFTLAVAPWQEFLDPPARARGGLGALPADDQDLLSRRFGWGGPAHTLAELAAARMTTVMKAAVRERRALRAALRAGRA